MGECDASFLGVNRVGVITIGLNGLAEDVSGIAVLRVLLDDGAGGVAMDIRIDNGVVLAEWKLEEQADGDFVLGVCSWECWEDAAGPVTSVVGVCETVNVLHSKGDGGKDFAGVVDTIGVVMADGETLSDATDANKFGSNSGPDVTDGKADGDKHETDADEVVKSWWLLILTGDEFADGNCADDGVAADEVNGADGDDNCADDADADADVVPIDNRAGDNDADNDDTNAADDSTDKDDDDAGADDTDIDDDCWADDTDTDDDCCADDADDGPDDNEAADDATTASADFGGDVISVNPGMTNLALGALPVLGDKMEGSDGRGKFENGERDMEAVEGVVGGDAVEAGRTDDPADKEGVNELIETEEDMGWVTESLEGQMGSKEGRTDETELLLHTTGLGAKASGEV